MHPITIELETTRKKFVFKSPLCELTAPTDPARTKQVHTLTFPVKQNHPQRVALNIDTEYQKNFKTTYPFNSEKRVFNLKTRRTSDN